MKIERWNCNFHEWPAIIGKNNLYSCSFKTCTKHSGNYSRFPQTWWIHLFSNIKSLDVSIRKLRSLLTAKKIAAIVPYKWFEILIIYKNCWNATAVLDWKDMSWGIIVLYRVYYHGLTSNADLIWFLTAF